MGQATIDLPDPLDAPVVAAAGNADELLSELAGAEIDRLLAALDVQSGASSGQARTPTDANDASAGDPELNALFQQLQAESQTVAGNEAAAAVKVRATQVPSRAQDHESVIAHATLVPASSELPAADAAMSGRLMVDPLAEVHTTAAEHAALLPGEDAGEVADDAAPRRSSPLVRALELVNAPLASCSDWLRELLGKLAILTLLNAAGLLLFVLLFRRR